jgi:hypothetical protein
MPERRSVLLIPGLFSPRWHFWGLRRSLRQSGFDAIIWDGSSVFGELETSIARLSECLRGHSSGLNVVTHSFGDWLFRQVAARGDAGNVARVVSLVPVMGASCAARVVKPLGKLAPELGVMASEERAAAALQTPAEIQRLIVWSRIDPWVRRVAAQSFVNTRETEVPGTHNTLLWQPRVHRLVVEHLCAADVRR